MNEKIDFLIEYYKEKVAHKKIWVKEHKGAVAYKKDVIEERREIFLLSQVIKDLQNLKKNK